MLSEEMNFSRLNPAEIERLSILSEECGEVIQAISKILRHGFESDNEGKLPVSNRSHLAQEIGHVQFCIDWLVGASDVELIVIEQQRVLRPQRIQPYLHHNLIYRSSVVKPESIC